MYKLLCIIGKSGSGKDFITKKLQGMGTSKLVSNTTRQPREGEVDGEDYNFKSIEEFNSDEANGKFAEVVDYNGCKYGFLKSELAKTKTSHCVAIVTPSGYHQLKKLLPDVEVVPVYLETKDEERKAKLLERHKDESNLDFYIQQIEQRIEQDKFTFKNVFSIKNLHSYYVNYDFDKTNLIVQKLNAILITPEYSKPTLVCDFDDVIVPTLAEAVNLCNQENGTNLTVEDFREWDVNKVYDGFGKYFYAIDFTKIEEKNNSIQHLKELSEDFEISIATASHVDKFKEKEKWIHENLPFIHKDNIMLVRNKAVLRGDVLVDDGIHNFGGDFSMKCLYTTPANKEFNINAFRINSLDELVQRARIASKIVFIDE